MIDQGYNLLRYEDCQTLIEQARPLLRSSRSQGRQRQAEHARLTQGPIVFSLRSETARLAGQPITHVEPVEVVRYKVGDHSVLHCDNVPGRSPRLLTLLVYLNECEGGNTVFPFLEVNSEPKAGTFLVWTSQNKDGSTDLKSKHLAEPVIAGEKWVAVVWVRPEPYEGD